MRTVTPLTTNKFLNIKSVVDPDNHVNGYQFAERRGVDSIAFICFDRNPLKATTPFIVNREYTPPTDEFHLRAFGGSLDKDTDHIGIVKAELKEEVGFEDGDILPLGRAFVSTQMNQYCYLFMVTVDSSTIGEREPENAIEAMAAPQWLSAADIVNGDDWKAITIMFKWSTSAKGLEPAENPADNWVDE